MAKKTKQTKLFVTREEYKGHPLIAVRVKKKDKFPFRFGLSKAKKLQTPEVRKAIDAFVLEQVKVQAAAAKKGGRSKATA